VAKISEVKHAADENVNDYFSRANKIVWEVKYNIEPTNFEIPDVTLPAAVAKQWEDLNQCW
jgi:hypothetical protein